MGEAAHVRPFGPRILAQFGAVVVIWGSTWIVIRSQLGVVPPSWSVAYRFLIASAVLMTVVLARAETRAQLRAFGARGHGFALLVGLAQFSLNFNLVYRAEQHLTSGLVSLLFALLIVPNAILGHYVLGQHITRRFVVGSLIAIAGLVLLFARDLTAPGGHSAGVLWGLAMGVAAIGCASIGNVLQATPVGRSLPAQPSLALAMAYGGVLNVGYAAATAGPPVMVWTPAFVGGLAYLAVVCVGARVQPLLQPAAQYRTRARGIHRRADPGAGDGAVDAVRRLSLDAAGGRGRGPCDGGDGHCVARRPGQASEESASGGQA